MTENTELLETLESVEESVVKPGAREKIVADLMPVYERLEKWQGAAQEIEINTEDENAEAVAIIELIDDDIKAVKEHVILETWTTAFNKLHKACTGLRKRFVEPLEASRKQIKGKVMDWQMAEEEKAAAEQAKLQAEADEQARKQREKLEKEAAKLKTPEKKEERLEQAEAVVAPTVRVEPPKRAVKMQMRWFASVVDASAFLAACVERPELQGYIEISESKLARGKSANKLLEAPGIVFEQKPV